MELQRIDSLPDHKPQLTAQERVALLSLPEGERKLAVAEDWSVILQNQRWTMEKLMLLNNYLVGYGTVLNFWQSARTVFIWALASAGGVYALLKIFKVI